MQYILCSSVENSPQSNPIIGRIDQKSGHGSGRPTKKLVQILAHIQTPAIFVKSASDFSV